MPGKTLANMQSLFPKKSPHPNLKEEDIIYMRRCLQLARNGQQNAQPNPMVGLLLFVIAESSEKAITCAAEKAMQK